VVFPQFPPLTRSLDRLVGLGLGSHHSGQAGVVRAESLPELGHIGDLIQGDPLQPDGLAISPFRLDVTVLGRQGCSESIERVAD
jgi:hypothetical protein